MKLVDQWHAMEADFPHDWEDVRLTLTTEQPSDLPRAAQVLGSINVGRVGDALVFQVRSSAGPQGKQTAMRLFERLDRDRIWCHLEQSDVQVPVIRERRRAAVTHRDRAASVAESWDRALDPLPSDWTDLLCELEIESSTLLPRAALLCAPLNPARSGSRLVFTFRCSGRSGYGVSPSMARRCFERLDNEGIVGSASRSPRPLGHGQRRHPGAGVARGRQDAVAFARSLRSVDERQLHPVRRPNENSGVTCKACAARKRPQETGTRPPLSTGLRASLP